MFEYALESMGAHVQSRFGQELDKLWQTVIAYRETELKNETSFRSKERKLKNFFAKEIAPKFMDVTYKYTGLYIDSVKYVNILYGSSFCTWIFISDMNGTFQLENILDGGYLKRYWGYLVGDVEKGPLTADMLMKLALSYDAVNGCIKPEMRDKIKKVVHSDIGFDLNLAFLMEDQLPKNSGVRNFTAREITAIMLHEIGHTLTMIEHAGDTYAQVSSFQYLTEAFRAKNSGNPAEAMKLALLVANKAQEVGQTQAATEVRKLVSKFASDVNAAGAAAKPQTLHSLIGGLLIAVFALLNDLVVIPCNMLFGSAAFKRYASTAEQKRKYADFPVNERLCTWQERKADEYAFSHGYGADQVDALARLGQFATFFGKSEKDAEKTRIAEEIGKNISLFEKFKILAIAPLILGNYSYSLYPAGSKRFKELLNLTIQQLKAHGADPEYVAKYMADVERILDKMEHADKADDFLARAIKGYELFLVYCSIPSFVDALVHGRIRKEMEDLMNDLQDVGNNLIDYYGHKFTTLAQKDK